MFNPPSQRRSTTDRGGGGGGGSGIGIKSAEDGTGFIEVDDKYSYDPTHGPLTQLIPDVQIYISRSPVCLIEPIANKKYQQPALKEVLSHIKALGGENWCIWEFLHRKESLINQVRQDLRGQILPYRVPDLGLLTISFVIGFISSVVFWLNYQDQNMAIITLQDDCDAHHALLFGLCGVMQHKKVNAGSLTFSQWLDSLNWSLNGALLRDSMIPQIRSPLASSRTNGMDQFLGRAQTLAPSSIRQLKYLHSLLIHGESDPVRRRENRVFKIKCIMVDGFMGPADSVVVEIYHLNTTPLEHGRLPPCKLHKKRKKVNCPADGVTPRKSDEWEYIWWETLYRFQKSYKRMFSKAKEPPSGEGVSAHLDNVYNHYEKAKDGRRLRPLLSTPGRMIINTPSDVAWEFKPDQSITVLPTSYSLGADCVGQRDTPHGASCQWDFSHQGLVICGDVVVVVRQLLPVPDITLNRWAAGELNYNFGDRMNTAQPQPPSMLGGGSLNSLTAISTFHTGFLESECVELGFKDFDFFTPPLKMAGLPMVLRNIVNPRFQVHLILSAVDDFRPLTGGATTAASVQPQTMPPLGEADDQDFLSPTNHATSPSPMTCHTIPHLDLGLIDRNPETVESKSRNSLGRTLKDTNRLLFGRGGDRSITSNRKATSTSSARHNISSVEATPHTLGGGSVSHRSKYQAGTFIDMDDWNMKCIWRFTHRKVEFDLRGDINEFNSRHCVVPDYSSIREEWNDENPKFSREEITLSLKCSDNTLALTNIGEKLFFHDSGSTVEKSTVKKEHKTQRGSFLKVLNKLSFAKITFKQSTTLETEVDERAASRENPSASVSICEGLRRSGSFDDIGRKVHSCLDQDKNRLAPMCRSPPARLPSRKTEFCPTSALLDDIIAKKDSIMSSALAGSISRPSGNRDSILPPDVLDPGISELVEQEGYMTTKSSESGFQSVSRPVNTTTVAEKSAGSSPPRVLVGNPYDPPAMHPTPHPVPRVDVSTEPSSSGFQILEAAPKAKIHEEPQQPRMSLPTGLMAALNNKSTTKKRPVDQTSHNGATQTQPRMPADLKSALLNRSTVPAPQTPNEPPEAAAEARPPMLNAGLMDGIAGGMAGLRKSVGAPARKPLRPREGSMPDLGGGGGGLAALFAKRGEADSANQSNPKEPVRKAPLGRRLFWKPLDTTNLDETIFGELNEANSVMFAVDKENLSKVFSKDAKKNNKKGADGKTVAPVPTEDEGRKKVTVIDDRRAQNVGIVVLRLKTSPQELARQLLTMEFREEPAADMLEKLETIFFTEEEEIKLESHLRTGSPDDLRDVPERRLLPFRSATLPRGRPRTKILSNDLKWPGWVLEMTSSLEIIRSASREMRSCACFRAMLSAVLRWGNFVNYGSNELHIKAITLSSLLKLTEFKTTIDAKVTSLHYIVATLLASTDQMDDALALARMTNDMRSVRAAAKVTSEVLETTWKQLQAARELVRFEMNSFRSSYVGEDPNANCGINKLVEISERMRLDVERLEKTSEETMALVQSTARFFGDEEAAAAPSGSGRQFFVGSVFMTLDEFLRKFDDCIKDIIRRTALYASILSDDQTPQLVRFVTTYTGKPLSKNAMMAIEANRDFNRLERTRFG